MKRGDTVKVKHGRFAGRQGKVICIFRGLATLLQADSVAIQVKIEEAEVKEVIQAT